LNSLNVVPGFNLMVSLMAFWKVYFPADGRLHNA
jgi:hypothetical protein